MFVLVNRTKNQLTIDGETIGAGGVSDPMDNLSASAAKLVSQGILEVKSFGGSTRNYDWDQGIILAADADGSLSTPMVGICEVLLIANGPLFVRTTLSGQAASNDGKSMPMTTDEKFHMQITPGCQIAVIRNGSDTTLIVIPVK